MNKQNSPPAIVKRWELEDFELKRRKLSALPPSEAIDITGPDHEVSLPFFVFIIVFAVPRRFLRHMA